MTLKEKSVSSAVTKQKVLELRFESTSLSFRLLTLLVMQDGTKRLSVFRC